MSCLVKFYAQNIRFHLQKREGKTKTGYFLSTESQFHT